ncbi:MAG: hypothetical protein ACJ76L_05930 [Conexibacter sp.]
MAAIAYVLGPPLGGLAPSSDGYTFLEGVAAHPEPTELTRYAILVFSPLLLSLATASAPRWFGRVSESASNLGVAASQAALVAVVVASIAAQYRYTFGDTYTLGQLPPFRWRYFTPATLVVALLMASMLAGALTAHRMRRRAEALLRPESRRRRLLAGGVALGATAIWMLHAVHTDSEIANALQSLWYHLQFPLDETFAVLNGRTPLVDFSAQYGSLWPFVTAVPMLVFGKTVLVFTVVLCLITTAALLAIYGVFRRVTDSATAALVLYLPFLATSMFRLDGPLQDRLSPGSYYAAFPLRYAAPFFLAWLTARHIDRGRDRAVGAWLMFVVAGLAVLNNSDFGVPALAATLAALLWSAPRLTWASIGRFAAIVAAGVATAVALVATLTLVRAGALPQFGRLVDYARLYTVGGLALMPIPGVLGMHLLIFLTHTAAIAVATTRRLRGAPNRVLTGMLVWAGVFGLGAGSYYVGRSHPVGLGFQFSAWGLSLALLTVVAARELAGRRLRPTAVSAFIVLFGFGVMVCSLAQAPTPWGQIERLTTAHVPTENQPDVQPLVPSRSPQVRRFVASLADGRDHYVYKRGAPVAILLTTGHRIADAYGVVNVSPYTGIDSLLTVQRIETMLDALRAAGGNTLILPNPASSITLYRTLARRGFEPVTTRGMRPFSLSGSPLEQAWPGGRAIMKWVDSRHLHPEALR